MEKNSWITSSYLARYLFLNKVGIEDYKAFPSRNIENAAPEFKFAQNDLASGDSLLFNRFVSSGLQNRGESTINQYLESNGTSAFIVICNGELLVEKYYAGYQHSSICTSFSTAKSFVSALIGIAINENIIKSLDTPITTYLPELSNHFWSSITIRHLLSMSSGLKYDSTGIFPWNDEPRIYYSMDLRKLASQARFSETPGSRFHYNNYNLILLGMILERVTGVTVSKYLQEKIWKPLGMEYPASWSLDSQKSGMEKMESGLNARAIDFAKFGLLYLRKGDWNGKQIIPESWVIESTTIASDAKWNNYKYLWWVSSTGKGRFTAVGNLGQFIFIAPDKNSIILRFGKGKPIDWKKKYPQLFGSVLDMI